MQVFQKFDCQIYFFNDNFKKFCHLYLFTWYGFLDEVWFKCPVALDALDLKLTLSCLTVSQ